MSIGMHTSALQHVFLVVSLSRSLPLVLCIIIIRYSCALLFCFVMFHFGMIPGKKTYADADTHSSEMESLHIFNSKIKYLFKYKTATV